MTFSKRANCLHWWVQVVYYGHAGPWALIVMSSVLATGCTSIVWTGDCGAYTQRSVGAGFINVDGHGDLFVAVSMSDSLTGQAYVNENLLHTSCVGDSNSDGLDDLVVSSLLGRDLAWVVAAVRHVARERRLPTRLLFHDMPAGFKVHSKFFKEFFGHTVGGTGDANSDNLAGLAVSSLAWSAGSTSSGAVFVLFGSHGTQFPWGIADLHAGAGAVIQAGFWAWGGLDTTSSRTRFSYLAASPGLHLPPVEQGGDIEPRAALRKRKAQITVDKSTILSRK
eukprot:m51a1_g1453 hypothetical protein (280) ;mRNA; r:182783-186312